MTINELITHLKAAVAELEETTDFIGDCDVRVALDSHGKLIVQLWTPSGEQT